MFTGQLATISSRFANIIPGYLGVTAAIVVSPAPAHVVPSGSLQFLANATDQLGYALEVQRAFTWAVSAGNGTIGGDTGLFVAPAAAEIDTVRATDPISGITGTVNVTVKKSLASVSAGLYDGNHPWLNLGN